MSSETAALLVSEHLAGLDAIVAKYISAIVGCHTGNEDESLQDLIEPLLLAYGFAPQTIALFLTELGESVDVCKRASGFVEEKLIPLEAPIQIQEFISATHAKSTVDLEHTASKKQPLKTDAKNASKANKKLDSFAYDPYVPQYSLDNLDSFDSRGKNRDIGLDSFDISIPGRRILTNTSLSLTHGRKYGLVGRNGIGKSTLLRHLSARLLPVPQYISILHVEQEMAGDETEALQSVLKAHTLRDFLLQQETQIYAKLADDTMSDDLKAKWLHRMKIVTQKLAEIESEKAEAKASMILAGLGFSVADMRRPTKTFSGGWRMRLSLAGALLCQPDLLLLDEPTNMLDIPAVIWLEKYLNAWPNTLLVVSHDKAFLDNVATDILHMHNEKIDTYKGNFAQYLQTKEERTKNAQREYETQLQYRQHLQAFIDRWRYNASRASQAQSKLKILEKLPALQPVEVESSIAFQFPPVEQLPPPIIVMDEVTFGYEKNRILLSNVSFSLLLSSRVAIVGPNGAGKTTLLKLMTDVLQPLSGFCRRNGKLRFAFFTQHHVDQLDLSMNPVQYLASKFPGKLEEEYRRNLGAFGIGGPLGLQTIGTLSGGQKSRVVFALMNMQNPHILILDEPTNHLDMDSIDALVAAIKKFQGGVVVVSHDQKFVKACCNEIWTCSSGVVRRFDGEIEDYVKSIV